MLVHDPIKAKNILISEVYAPARVHRKDHFWDHLISMNNVLDLPWMLVGDFNEF